MMLFVERAMHRASDLSLATAPASHRRDAAWAGCGPLGALLSIAAAALLLAPRTAPAMAFAGAAPVTLIYAASVLADDTSADPTPMATANTPELMTAPAERRASASRSPSGAALIELPPDVTPGVPARPRYILGFRSESMRAWMKDLGVAARNCYAPMIRANTKISSEGLRGTLWLYARCSFD
jgi:hypothetical protein